MISILCLVMLSATKRYKGGNEMKVSEDVWKFYQQHLGYSDEEMKKFREHPRNEDVVSKAPAY